MPRDAVSRTAHVGTQLRKRNGGHKWVNQEEVCSYLPNKTAAELDEKVQTVTQQTKYLIGKQEDSQILTKNNIGLNKMP